jgi:hypothetical protein
MVFYFGNAGLHVAAAFVTFSFYYATFYRERAPIFLDFLDGVQVILFFSSNGLPMTS